MSAVKKNLFLHNETTVSTPRKKPRYHEFLSPRFLPVQASPNEMCSPTKKSKNKLTELKESIVCHNLKDLVGTEDIELFLVAKCGIKAAMLIFQALKYVPVRFPQRLEYTSNILVAGGLTKYFKTVVELNNCVEYISNTLDISRFDGNVPNEVLWKATNMFKSPHFGFIVTKAETCLETGCGGKLVGRKKDAVEVTVYTLDGPLPYLKTTLVCCKCDSR